MLNSTSCISTVKFYGKANKLKLDKYMRSEAFNFEVLSTRQRFLISWGKFVEESREDFTVTTKIKLNVKSIHVKN